MLAVVGCQAQPSAEVGEGSAAGAKALESQPASSYVIDAGSAPADSAPRRAAPTGTPCVTVGLGPSCHYASASECPRGVTCTAVSLCGGGPVYCCDEPPKCDEDAVQLAQPCPSGGSCYEREQCGVTITCLRYGSGADAG